jgi:hypothetical protein
MVATDGKSLKKQVDLVKWSRECLLTTTTMIIIL